jgi:hypothetical protein
MGLSCVRPDHKFDQFPGQYYALYGVSAAPGANGSTDVLHSADTEEYRKFAEMETPRKS